VISIREAVEGDFEKMLALFDEVAAERVYIGTEPGFDRERYRRDWTEGLTDSKRLLLVALDGDAQVGNLGLREHEGSGMSLGMLLTATHRRRGIGRALLEAAFAWARERGMTGLTLRVFPHNEAALALYRSAGFVAVQRRERDVKRQTGDVWDTIFMRKTL
jgi:[ribosomal protein S18]-alanine N-acetyltransferase